MDTFSANINGPLLSNVSIKGGSGKSFLKSLNPGEILKGKVSSILPGNKYVILVRGKNIVAESNLQLKEGSVYSLKVTTTFPSFSFNVIPEASGVEAELKEAVQILNKLDIPVNNMTRSIVLEMSKFDIAITRDTIISIDSFLAKFLKKPGNEISDRKILRTLLQFFAKGMVPDGKSVALMHKFFASPDAADRIIAIMDLKEAVEGLPDLDEEDELIMAAKQVSDDIITNKESGSFVRNIENFYNLLFSRIISSLKNGDETAANFVLLLKTLSLLQKVRLVNYRSQYENQLYYLPVVIEYDRNISIELFYRHRTISSKATEKIPGFSLHLFIRIGNSPPLHLHLQKRVEEMINLDFRHPVEENLEQLKEVFPDIKNSFRKLGFRIVKITAELAETSDDSYREDLFHPERDLVRSVNITG